MIVEFTPKTMLHASGVTIQRVTPEDDIAIFKVLSLVKNVYQGCHVWLQGNSRDWRFIEVWGDTDALGDECANWLVDELRRGSNG